jgi:fatty-acyl-CoA synthase
VTVGGLGEHIAARAGDDRPALLFEEQRWTYAEWVAECVTRAALFRAMRVDGPPHVGVLLDNVPDFTMWLGAAALTGATVVGINPTRRGAELARDVRHTDCQLVVTETSQLGLLDGLDLGAANGRVLVVDAEHHDSQLASHRSATLDDVTAGVDVDASTQYLLLFTSGTSGAPKAVICSHRRLAFVSAAMVGLAELTADDVTYISMPLFHSNALFTAWAPSVAVGAAVALRRRFSASSFLDDVRRFGATYFNYVGKPLAYILATPERPDDAANPLRRGYGNEANDADLQRFAERFGCALTDGYGQTETGASIVRVPGMPDGALGMAAPGVVVLDPATGAECERARFDADGRLLNADTAIGEIVNTGGTMFEGYWNNPEGNAERLRDGAYWTGDLAYRDEAGFFYFAGRSADWLRVDGENFAAAPIERILMRDPSVVLAAVYGVPDPEAGDQVMAALQLASGSAFDPHAFAAFCGSQPDLGPKWVPTYVRICAALPITSTNKVLKRHLVVDRWSVGGDELWWRRDRSPTFERFTPADAEVLAARFAAHGREHVLT